MVSKTLATVGASARMGRCWLAVAALCFANVGTSDVRLPFDQGIQSIVHRIIPDLQHKYSRSPIMPSHRQLIPGINLPAIQMPRDPCYHEPRSDRHLEPVRGWSRSARRRRRRSGRRASRARTTNRPQLWKTSRSAASTLGPCVPKRIMRTLRSAVLSNREAQLQHPEYRHR